jgi:KDO2-lipid IV(A) lauroyltransferase
MKASHIIEYVLFRACGLWVRVLPLKSARRIGETLGVAAYLLHYRREITLRNLRNAFPDLPTKTIQKYARGAFRSVGAAMIEFLWSPNLTKEVVRSYMRIDNPELIRECSARGKGVVLLTAHFGNWEFIAQAMLAYSDLPVHVIVKPQANKLVDRVIDSWRTMLGNKTIPMGISVREILRALHEGALVGIAADQTAPKESVCVTFFGREVPTFEGPAVLALKTGAAFLIGFPVFDAGGFYRAHLIEIQTGDLQGSLEEKVRQLTQRHVELTENAIRENPDHWMWMHKRWKHVPDRVEAGLS